MLVGRNETGHLSLSTAIQIYSFSTRRVAQLALLVFGRNRLRSFRGDIKVLEGCSCFVVRVDF